MPPKAPSSAAAATAIVNPQPVAAQSAATPRPVAVASTQAAYPARRSTLPAGIGLAPPPPSAAGDDEDRGGQYIFDDLKAGQYTFLLAVDSILMWPHGPSVDFKALAQVNADGTLSRGAGILDRPFGWGQSPPPYAVDTTSDNFKRWRRDLVRTYTGLGLPEVAAPGEAGGWERDEAGATVPPFYRFFTDTIGAAIVPIVLRASISVDLGYENRPKIRALAYQTSANGESYILAPTPRKLAPWIAASLGWEGERKTMAMKKGGEVEFVERIVGISPPAGMPTWKDLQ
jgi:hypothetical protein